MTAENHLVQIAREIEELESRFVASGNLGLHLKSEDEADYKRLAVEAKSILDGELGRLNDFSSNLLMAANSGSGGFLGGPSKASVIATRKIIEGAVNQIRRRPGLTNAAAPTSKQIFVSTSRLAELRTLPTIHWDFRRLVRLCEELNVCYAEGSYMAVGMLLRSIADHVPPIFSQSNFTQVANNYGGPQSFQRSMKHLEGSLRNIADSFLHRHIRKSEILPNESQLSFQADLDVLLAEVVRVSR